MGKELRKNPFQPLKNLIGLQQEISDAAKQDSLAKRPSPSELMIPKAVLEKRSVLSSHFDQGVAECQDEFQGIEEVVETHKSKFSEQHIKHKSDDLIESLSVSLTSSPSLQDCKFHRENFNKRKEDLERFKLENRLIYEPQRGITDRRILGVTTSVLVVALLYFVEAVFNASLFINEVGLIGGLTISLSSSLVNVVVGYIVGRLLWSRMYRGRLLSTKVFSVVGVLTFILVMTYMNFVIAMYRSLKAAAGNTFQEVNTSLAVWPFPYLDRLDFESVLVLLVGFVFAIAALLDGYFSDDPFPGYGAKYRLCLESRGRVRAAHEKYTAEHNSVIKKCREDLDTLFNTASSSIHAWSAAVNVVQKRFVDFEKWVNDLLDVDTMLWNTYRSTHSEYRVSDYPTPKLLEAPLDSKLISDLSCDANHVFRDASHLYMSDEQRVEITAGFEATLASNRQQIESRLDETVEDLHRVLAALTESTDCPI